MMNELALEIAKKIVSGDINLEHGEQIALALYMDEYTEEKAQELKTCLVDYGIVVRKSSTLKRPRVFMYNDKQFVVKAGEEFYYMSSRTYVGRVKSRIENKDKRAKLVAELKKLDSMT